MCLKTKCRFEIKQGSHFLEARALSQMADTISPSLCAQVYLWYWDCLKQSAPLRQVRIKAIEVEGKGQQ